MDTNSTPRQEARSRKSELFQSESDWLRRAAATHERAGEPVWALLYRNNAFLIDQQAKE